MRRYCLTINPWLSRSLSLCVNKAIQLFELNASNYPESYNAFDSLAEAYQKFGDNKKAIEYRKVESE